MRQLLMRSMNAGEQESEQRETIGSDPGKVSFAFNVTANFALDKGAGKPKAPRNDRYRPSAPRTSGARP